MPKAAPPERGLRLLSLGTRGHGLDSYCSMLADDCLVDGGGVRGLSSLLILQNLMKNINPEKPPKPCEVFDLIGGTSTGGYVESRQQLKSRARRA